VRDRAGFETESDGLVTFRLLSAGLPCLSSTLPHVSSVLSKEQSRLILIDWAASLTSWACDVDRGGVLPSDSRVSRRERQEEEHGKEREGLQEEEEEEEEDWRIGLSVGEYSMRSL